MIKNVKITVIIPSLNVGRYIEKCIKSVVSQSLEEIEIFCVDAGSNDGTVEIIQNYEKRDSRVSFIHSDIKSYGYQLNLGISRASGKYISIIESDDIADKDMLLNLYRVAEKNGADYAKGRAELFFEFNNARYSSGAISPITSTKDENKILDPSRNPELFISDNFLWYGIYKNNLLKQFKFRETKGAAFQDIDALFWIISRSKTAVYTDKVVYYYRQDNIGASSYNSKSLSYTKSEYEYICDHYLEELADDFFDAYYRKLVGLTIDRMLVMADSGRYWDECEKDIAWIQNKIKEGFEKEYVSENLYDYSYISDVILFLQNPLQLFEKLLIKSKENMKKVEELLQFIGDKKVILFGSGVRGRKLSVLLAAAGKCVIEFWDNDCSKQGTVVNGLKINAPHQLDDKQIVVVISIKDNIETIKEQVAYLGINKRLVYHPEILLSSVIINKMRAQWKQI